MNAISSSGINYINNSQQNNIFQIDYSLSIYKRIFLVPRLDSAGGVANYYQALKPYLNENCIYIFRGKKKNEKISFLRFINDYLKYLRSANNNTIIISTSLGQGSIFRDGLYAWLCPKSTKKIIFFRGWDPDFQRKIDNSKFLKKWIRKTFLTADHIIVLSSKFKEKLIQWGYNKGISLETTLVDETLLNSFDINNIPPKTKNILFLSAITRNKGIFEALEAFHLLKKKIPELIFHVAGDGNAMSDVDKKINKNEIKGVNILGYVKGDQKTDVYKNAGIFLFPSYHEGMPNAVLEAMAFGLPVITTRVGGLPDFFEDGKMGLFLDNHNPEHIAEKIEYLLERPELIKKMSEYNYRYAKERFYASKVAKRLEKIINDIIHKRK